VSRFLTDKQRTDLARIERTLDAINRLRPDRYDGIGQVVARAYARYEADRRALLDARP
jgi:hypothetical protein